MTDNVLLLTVTDAAKRLKVSDRTLRRYIDAQQIDYCILNPGSPKRRIRFTEEHLNAFVQKHSSEMQTQERPKRAYHKTAKRYARKKKPTIPPKKRGKVA